MSKSNEVIGNYGEYFELPNPGLKSYFGRVREGQSLEYRTTFAKGNSVEQVLQEWSPTLETISKRWPTLVEFENDLRSKVGPMSIMLPLSERMKDIDHYYDDILLSSKPVNSSAIAAVVSEWNKCRGLNCRSHQKVVDLMKKSTNSGSPYFTKRKQVVKDTVPLSTYVDGKEVVQMLSGTKWLSTAILGWRGQEGGPTKDDVKQRVVWMFPFGINIAELACYQPLIEAAQRFNLVPAWVSMEAVDKSITQLFDTKGKDDLVICTDFSKFDQHFNPTLQNCAETILSKILAPNEVSQCWLNDVFPIKYMIPLSYDYGKIRRGIHGMASGSGGTNADETLVHRCLQYEAALVDGTKLNPYSQCLGDDGILSYPGITVDSVLRTYTSHGLEMNESKQSASTTECTYLRRWHHMDYRVDGVCVGVYSTYRALGRLMEQERYMDPEVWGPKAIALRQLSILENVKFHPLCEDFAKFCMKRDKYRLGIDIPDFLDNIDSISKEITDNIPDLMGYTKTSMSKEVSGISDWWIVRFLKSQR